MVISYIIHICLEAAPRLARLLRPTTAWNYRATRACALTHTHKHTHTHTHIHTHLWCLSTYRSTVHGYFGRNANRDNKLHGMYYLKRARCAYVSFTCALPHAVWSILLSLFSFVLFAVCGCIPDFSLYTWTWLHVCVSIYVYVCIQGRLDFARVCVCNDAENYSVCALPSNWHCRFLCICFYFR